MHPACPAPSINSAKHFKCVIKHKVSPQPLAAQWSSSAGLRCLLSRALLSPCFSWGTRIKPTSLSPINKAASGHSSPCAEQWSSSFFYIGAIKLHQEACVFISSPNGSAEVFQGRRGGKKSHPYLIGKVITFASEPELAALWPSSKADLFPPAGKRGKCPYIVLLQQNSV